MVAPAQSDSLVLRRRFSAQPAVVFEVWTRPEHLVKWFRPSSDFKHQFVEIDPRVGGQYRVAFESPDGRVDVVGGEYLEVVPSRRLVFTWMWEPPNEFAGIASQVAVEFHAVEEGTELIVTHQLSDSEMRERHKEGWSGALDQLPAVVDECCAEGGC